MGSEQSSDKQPLTEIVANLENKEDVPKSEDLQAKKFKEESIPNPATEESSASSVEVKKDPIKEAPEPAKEEPK